MRAHPCGARAAIVASVVLGAATGAAAQVGPLRPSAGVVMPAQQPRPRQPGFPFPPLNDRQREQALRELQARAGVVTPQNVCGMTVVPAPNVDPKAVKKVPEDKKFTMRALPRTEFGWPASCERFDALPELDTQSGR
jgi:hypothetical protein